jgi:uncharacterized membrane protein YphA (DoxX/SURF4 family)
MSFVLCLTIQIAAALIFVLAAFGKLRDLESFRQILSAYQLLPGWCARAVAPLVPMLEGAIAVGLVIRVYERVAAFAAAGLLMLFALAMAVNLLRGRTSLHCGCTWSNGAGDRIAPWMVVRNFAMALAVLGSLHSEPLSLSWLDAFVVGCAAAAFALLHHAMPGLLLQQRPRNAEE